MRVRVRIVLAIPLAGLAVGLLGAWRLDRDPGAELRQAAERSRTRSWARQEGGAGPSILPKRVPLASKDELRRLEDLPGFHDYAMRCSSCHELPDPAAYPAQRWIGKVAVMREHIRRAGVMPPPDRELEAATRFLGAASDSLRRK